MEISTTWKTAAVWFGVGVVSTALFALGLKVPGAILWGLSLGYIAYKRLDIAS